MSMRADRRELCAGLAIAAFGLVAAVDGAGHTVGTLAHMGTGYMPVVLGVVLIALGAVIGIAGLLCRGAPPVDASEFAATPTDWRGFACITAGLVVFVAVAARFGFAPATFLLVVIAAFADRDSTLVGAIILAIVMTLVVVLLFGRLLQIPFTVVSW